MSCPHCQAKLHVKTVRLWQWSFATLWLVYALVMWFAEPRFRRTVMPMWFVGILVTGVQFYRTTRVVRAGHNDTQP